VSGIVNIEFTREELAFAEPAAAAVTAQGYADLKRVKAYAEKHALDLVTAYKHIDDPQLVALDEVHTMAREKGITLTEAFILAGVK
jgi:hypothetical protein